MKILLEEVEKREKSGKESSDSSENSNELNKEASVPAAKRRKLNDGKSVKSKLGKTPRMRKATKVETIKMKTKIG